MEETMIKISQISKHYRLGQIGGTTLREEIQRWNAKRRHEEDPTRKIGEKESGIGESFMALDDVSVEVKKGERVGIIGHNGAGKSTLLKLISRITAPSSGDIWMNGRVASMLEVGTGFHGELTGRENIYMNGAILGMKKKEIDEKIEDIIEFSECRQFIDTPVKRYSSGMYVKLAFSVAAHLDSEIMIMDEVLAVGDMAFQKKCLEKMSDVSKSEGRTILYVSHNMNTIRQLCERSIVLDHGKITFDGGVEEAIDVYLGARGNTASCVDLSVLDHDCHVAYQNIIMTSIKCLENDTAIYDVGSAIKLRLDCTCKRDMKNVFLRVTVIASDGTPVTMMTTDHGVDFIGGMLNQLYFDLDVSMFVPGLYLITPTLYDVNQYGQMVHQDVVYKAFSFEVKQTPGFNNNLVWQTRYWGFFYNKPIEVQMGVANTCM